MPVSEGGASSFQVHISGVIAQKLREVQHQANLEGQGKAALSAFRAIVGRLRQDPMDFGEMLYYLPALRMQIRHAAIKPIFVDFAVSKDHALVFIKGVELLGR
jgi:hypothetical protein